MGPNEKLLTDFVSNLGLENKLEFTAKDGIRATLTVKNGWIFRYTSAERERSALGLIETIFLAGARKLESKKSKWLKFTEQEAKCKTKVYLVQNNENGFPLGKIMWYAPFRKYSFFPDDNTVFEAICLQDITDFIKNLMEERRVKRLNEKPLL